MIVIEKGPAPRALTDNVKRLKETPDVSVCYRELEAATLDAVRAQLVKEQGYLCAYCMRRIGRGGKAVKIEHYLPRHPDDGEEDQSSVDYRNLLAVCEGGKGVPHSHQTCDTHKGNKRLSVDPLKPHTIATIAYKANGEIYSRDEAVQYDLNVTLNLNCSHTSLRQGRKAVIDTLYREINRDCKGRGRVARRHYCEKKLEGLLSASSEKKEYLGVMVWVLTRQIRKCGS